MKRKLTIALAGNPNAGKTTIFNNLTGSNQHVGNYPGVTVEKAEGTLVYKDTKIHVIDLPGTYSLSAYSPEEVVSRNFLIEENIDVIVNIVDATNLERNLNLTVQLIELDLPLVIALNMSDMAHSQGIKINQELLSQLLGCPIVPVVGSKNKGTAELLEMVLSTADGQNTLQDKTPRYAKVIEEQIVSLERVLPLTIMKTADNNRNIRRWLAIKLLENDEEIISYIKKQPQAESIMVAVKKSQEAMRKHFKQDPEITIVEGRYAFIRGTCRETIKYDIREHASLTDRIDSILLNRVLGLPIFLVLMWALFQFTFALGTPLMELLDAGIAWFASLLDIVLPDGLFKSLLIDGIIAGVGGVLIFLPNILLLFLGISFLEGTGYMARAAFVTDRMMHAVGLHGKSFIPMVLGFGCSVPAIMSTRTLENTRDRFVTILIIPLMSCGAKLPVYTLFSAAFFSQKVAGNVLFSIYIIGILLALVMAKIFRTWVLPGDSEPFVMELPAYRLPTVKSVLLQIKFRALLYLKKAGTVILVASMIVWALFTLPLTPDGPENALSPATMEASYAGKVGHFVEPLIKPLGFDWKAGIALLAGFSGKEIVVSTLGTLYSIEESDRASASSTTGDSTDEFGSIAERIKSQSGFTPLTAYVFMLFVLIYVPCIATVAIIYKETNSWGWAGFSIAYTTLLAWIVSFIAYRVGLLLGFY